MAKVNLITILWGNSNGAQLQAYATCKILEEQGHDVTVIYLMNPKFKVLSRYKTLRAFLANFINDGNYRRFRKSFFPTMTKRMWTIDLQKLPPAEYVVVGSDQVWNPDITYPIDKSFFLDFVPENCRRVSLASSFGKGEWTKDVEYTKYVGEQFSKFKAVSVREISGVNILKNVFQVESTQLIDPTIAWSNYDEILGIDVKQKQQIYPFIFSPNEESNKICNEISKRYSLPLYQESFLENKMKHSPMLWLKHIKESSIVITNSFHCLAFCLIFHKKFFVLTCGSSDRMPRLYSLLDLINHRERYIPDCQYLINKWESISGDIDFDNIDKVLSRERKKYKEFVKSNIE